jgi:hypothetical protein
MDNEGVVEIEEVEKRIERVEDEDARDLVSGRLG